MKLDQAAVRTLNRRIRELENRVELLEEITETAKPPRQEIRQPWNGNFREFPPTLRADHIAYIYGFTLSTVRKMAQQRNRKIPTPCTSRPFGWNREDARRHYGTRTVWQQ